MHSLPLRDNHDHSNRINLCLFSSMAHQVVREELKDHGYTFVDMIDTLGMIPQVVEFDC